MASPLQTPASLALEHRYVSLETQSSGGSLFRDLCLPFCLTSWGFVRLPLQSLSDPTGGRLSDMPLLPVSRLLMKGPISPESFRPHFRPPLCMLSAF